MHVDIRPCSVADRRFLDNYRITASNIVFTGLHYITTYFRNVVVLNDIQVTTHFYVTGFEHYEYARPPNLETSYPPQYSACQFAILERAFRLLTPSDTRDTPRHIDAPSDTRKHT